MCYVALAGTEEMGGHLVATSGARMRDRTASAGPDCIEATRRVERTTHICQETSGESPLVEQ